MARMAIPMTLTLAVIAQFPSNQVAIAQNNNCPTAPLAVETDETNADKAVKISTAVVFGGAFLQILLHPKDVFGAPNPDVPKLPTAANTDKPTNTSVSGR
jgi:hypothetical protein